MAGSRSDCVARPARCQTGEQTASAARAASESASGIPAQLRAAAGDGLVCLRGQRQQVQVPLLDGGICETRTCSMRTRGLLGTEEKSSQCLGVKAWCPEGCRHRLHRKIPGKLQSAVNKTSMLHVGCRQPARTPPSAAAPTGLGCRAPISGSPRSQRIVALPGEHQALDDVARRDWF